MTYSFGPGPITPAVKAIIWANVALFVISLFVPAIIDYLGLTPAAVVGRAWIWQPATYMFLHANAMHILFNMLGVWMFGVELERMWGTKFFARFYALTGVGAGLTVILSSLSEPGSGIAHTTHLGGLVAAYLYLKGTRVHLLSEMQYRFLKWRINRRTT
jgi:membrane associated rhomboid family serine protease